VVGAALGAGVGLAVGTAIYLSVGPVLERSSGIAREMQGLLWNLVPLLTVVGAFLGALLLRSHRR
jgi:H+/Cl- antiporter ClcA